MKILTSLGFTIFLFSHVFSFGIEEKGHEYEVISIWESTKGLSFDDQQGENIEDIHLPSIELSIGDTWIFDVADYQMTPNIQRTFEVEIRVEDIFLEADSTYYAISYWPSENTLYGHYRFIDFGYYKSALNFLSAAEIELYNKYDDSYGIIELVNKASNRVLRRQLFIKKENGENVILTEKKMNASATFYGNGRGNEGPEFRLPLMRFPFACMKDTCWGSINEVFPREVMPSTLELQESCDTALLKYSKYWKEDSLVVEFRTRTSLKEEYKFRSRLYWVEETKWWVKHESAYNGPGGLNAVPAYGSLGFGRNGKFLDVRLKEEKLSGCKD